MFGHYPSFWSIAVLWSCLVLQSTQASEISPFRAGRAMFRSVWPDWLASSVKGKSPGLLETTSEIRPQAVRKMSEDESEMFFQSYWTFDFSPDHDEAWFRQTPDPNLVQNITVISPPQAPFALHHDYDQTAFNSFGNAPLRFPLAFWTRSLSKRDYKCPGDTLSCSNINQPDVCCPNGQVCQSLSGGGVGCCAYGQTCSQDVAPCAQGYSSCPEGGGCCVPGYSCAGPVGCLAESTATVTVEATTSTTSTEPSTSLSSEADTSVVISGTSTFTVVTSVIKTVTSFPPSVSPPTSSSTTLIENSGVTKIPLAPLRPTSGAAATTTVTPSICPTGFYACLAHYDGGCCRTGRDCSTTSCAPATTSTAVDTDGVVVGVPAQTTGEQGLGKNGCALGWYTCGTGGGGCCPSGYTCGTADGSCTVTGANLGGGVTGTAKVVKESSAVKMLLKGSALWVALSAQLVLM